MGVDLDMGSCDQGFGKSRYSREFWAEDEAVGHANTMSKRINPDVSKLVMLCIEETGECIVCTLD